MADFYMHTTLAREFVDATKKDSDYLLLGAQGPDYFFYGLSRDTKEASNHVGNLIHRQKTQWFLHHLLAQAIDRQSLELYDYVLGFLTHHALDISIHPYIFYYTGVFDEKDPKTHPYAGLHLQFERKVDIAFIHHHLGFKPHLRPSTSKTLPFKKFPSIVEDAVDKAVKETFEISGAGALFSQGYQIMRLVERILVVDRFKIKRHLLKLVTPYKKVRSIYYQDLSHAQNIQDFDYLNLKKTPWLHPVLGSSHQESVMDCYEKAKAMVQAWLNALEEAYDQKDPSILSSLLPNASYESGLPLNKPQRMSYFKNYRTLLKK